MSSTETQEEKERQEQVQELQRLLACYQVASRDDKNVVSEETATCSGSSE